MEFRAADVMNPEVICVPADMDVRELTKLFLDRGITGAPVVDQDGNLLGVISQTDLLFYSLSRDDELKIDSHFYQGVRLEGRHLPQGFQIEDVNTATVSEVMTPVVHSVTERASAKSVADLMRRNHIHRVIVRRGRKVVGIISALDLLKAITRAPRSAKSRAAASKGSRARKRPGTMRRRKGGASRRKAR